MHSGQPSTPLHPCHLVYAMQDETIVFYRTRCIRLCSGEVVYFFIRCTVSNLKRTIRTRIESTGTRLPFFDIIQALLGGHRHLPLREPADLPKLACQILTGVYQRHRALEPRCSRIAATDFSAAEGSMERISFMCKLLAAKTSEEPLSTPRIRNALLDFKLHSSVWQVLNFSRGAESWRRLLAPSDDRPRRRGRP